MPKLSRAKPKPTWFDVQFSQPLEFATLHVPDEHTIAFEDALKGLLTRTALWPELMALREQVIEPMASRRNWQHVKAWHLVHHLKTVADINIGVDHFPPSKYKHLPLDLRQALFLCYCLMRGEVMLDENPAEDFGLPELSHIPRHSRAVLAASKPLGYLVSRPYVIAEICRRRTEDRGGGIDAGLLLTLDEGGEAVDWQWHALFQEAPQDLLARLSQHLAGADREWGTKQPLGLASGQLYFTAKELQGDRTAGEVLARALEGEFAHFSTAVRNDLKDVQRRAREDSKREAEAATLVVRFEDTDREEQIQQGETLKAELRHRIDNPKTDAKLRELARLLLENPDQADDVLAQRIPVKSIKTVRSLKTRLRQTLPQ